MLAFKFVVTFLRMHTQFLCQRPILWTILC